MASTAAQSLSLVANNSYHHLHLRQNFTAPVILGRRRRRRSLLTCAAAASDPSPKPLASPPEIERFSSNTGSQDGYIALFVRMLGLDNDPLDREQAVTTLWKFSEGGKDCIDGIMKFPGCINLVVSLLKSDSTSTSEAAAGLLRTVSSVSSYRGKIAESGAIEELTYLLCQSCLTSEMKEHSLCTLWNLSVAEVIGEKVISDDLLPILIKFLDDEEIKIKEAAGGILANLALNTRNHNIMVEAGVIPKLADLVKNTSDGFKVIRKEAKTALLEISKEGDYMILIIEEGLIRVPIIGASAYKSFKPRAHSWPSLPDGTNLQRTSRPSRYGASELLLGLNISSKEFSLEEIKMNAIVGRSQQQFLARIGAIETEDEKNHQLGSSSNDSNPRYTLLPWIDGIARLVLILGLDEVSAVARAAHSIADASINEYMRISFKEAGAVRDLVQLLSHTDVDIRHAVTRALERLSFSDELCQTIEAEGGLNPLVSILKQTNGTESLLEKTVTILSRILEPGKDMKVQFHDKLVDGPDKLLDAAGSSEQIKGLKEAVYSEEMPRTKVLDTEVVLCLIKVLKTSSPDVQVKVASILEYIVTFEPCAVTPLVSNIETGLNAVFQQGPINWIEDNNDDQPELSVIEIEETGQAIAAASRLLTKLLHLEVFRSSVNCKHFISVLRKILKSDYPLNTKDWVAACLVKLESAAISNIDTESLIDAEVTIYEAIPRLVEQLNSVSYESQKAAVLDLKNIISKGAEFSRAVAAAGGIFPLVKLMEECSADVLEPSLTILYNLSMDSENHTAIIAAGAVPILRRIVLAEGPQWPRALNLLRTLPT